MSSKLQLIWSAFKVGKVLDIVLLWGWQEKTVWLYEMIASSVTSFVLGASFLYSTVIKLFLCWLRYWYFLETHILLKKKEEVKLCLVLYLKNVSEPHQTILMFFVWPRRNSFHWADLNVALCYLPTVFNLTNNFDVENTKLRMEQYQRENRDIIQRNKAKLVRTKSSDLCSSFCIFSAVITYISYKLMPDTSEGRAEVNATSWALVVQQGNLWFWHGHHIGQCLLKPKNKCNIRSLKLIYPYIDTCSCSVQTASKNTGEI